MVKSTNQRCRSVGYCIGPIAVFVALNVVGFVSDSGVNLLRFGWPFQFGHNSQWTFDADSPEMRDTIPLVFADNASADRPAMLLLNTFICVAAVVGVWLYMCCAAPRVTVSLLWCLAFVGAVCIWFGVMRLAPSINWGDVVWYALSFLAFGFTVMAIAGYATGIESVVAGRWNQKRVWCKKRNDG